MFNHLRYLNALKICCQKQFVIVSVAVRRKHPNATNVQIFKSMGLVLASSGDWEGDRKEGARKVLVGNATVCNLD